jgi:hypothetical protein
LVVETSKSTSSSDPSKSVKQAFIWSAKDGMVGLGFLSLAGAKIESKATGISSDGSIVVGESQGEDGKETFSWDPMNGMRPLSEALAADLEMDLSGWTFDKRVTFSRNGSWLMSVVQDEAGGEHLCLARSLALVTVPALPSAAGLALSDPAAVGEGQLVVAREGGAGWAS